MNIERKVGYRANLQDIILPAGCDLSRRNLEGFSLADAELIGCKFREANFDGADLRRANFSGCDLRGASFRSANLHGARLMGADCTGADMEGAILRNARFYSDPDRDEDNLDSEGSSINVPINPATLREVNLDAANLAGADLRECIFYNTTMRNAVLVDTDFSGKKKPKGITGNESAFKLANLHPCKADEQPKSKQSKVGD